MALSSDLKDLFVRIQEKEITEYSVYGKLSEETKLLLHSKIQKPSSGFA